MDLPRLPSESQHQAPIRIDPVAIHSFPVWTWGNGVDDIPMTFKYSDWIDVTCLLC